MVLCLCAQLDFYKWNNHVVQLPLVLGYMLFYLYRDIMFQLICLFICVENRSQLKLWFGKQDSHVRRATDA